jgi:hypothetical protein
MRGKTAKRAIKKACNTHFGLKRDFVFEFLQVYRAQSDLHLRELDGNFGPIHVCVMHNAYKDA